MHAYKVMDQTLEKFGPMVYKIGFTHCPYTRFYNSKFGYVNDRQRWESMVVVFASHEAIGPAFVEAALIQRYKGFLPAQRSQNA